MLRQLWDEAGVDVGAPGPNGWPAVHLAAINGHGSAVRELLRVGAAREALAHGKSALDVARNDEVRRALTEDHGGLEAALSARAQPLVASDAAGADGTGRALLRDGVARLDGCVTANACAALKAHVLRLRDAAAAGVSGDDGGALARHIPGTRIALSRPMDVGFADRRADVLLPVEDALVYASLRRLVPRVYDALVAGAAALPPIEGELSFVGAAAACGGGSGGGGGESAAAAAAAPPELELIECAALIAEPGCEHQSLHADYRRSRSAAAAAARMPPRLVAFLYLQDTPGREWGATHFLPGTATAEAHRRFFEGEAPDDAPVRCLTLRCGDAAVYDASVLHFGGANAVPGNTRVIFYIGAARKGEAARVAAANGDASSPGLVAAPAIPLSSFL